MQPRCATNLTPDLVLLTWKNPDISKRPHIFTNPTSFYIIFYAGINNELIQIMGEPETFRPTRTTIPMVLVGTLMGSLVCVANMYFSLQIGSVSTMPTFIALGGFAVFRALSRCLPPAYRHTFTATDNVVVQTIASSIAGVPLAAALESIIPAFEFLRKPEEGGVRRFSVLELFVWCLGISLFGTVFAVPFRSYFVLRERLRFPAGYATAILIGVLHGDDKIARNAELDKQGLSCLDDRPFDEPAGGDAGNEVSSPRDGQNSRFEWASNIALVFKASAGTVTYVVLSYFLPILTKIPIFGTAAASDWLWFLTLSPAFAGFGMILDPPIACAMLLGAILGWGILSPIAKIYGWAPGPVGDMEIGARGWLIWVSVGFLLGDAVARVIHESLRLTLRVYHIVRVASSKGQQYGMEDDEDLTQQPLLTGRNDSGGSLSSNVQTLMSRGNGLVSNKAIVIWLLGSCSLCLVCTSVVFRSDVLVHLIIFAVVLAMPLCFIVMQSSGETDTVPSNSLSNACQFLFVLILSQASRSRLLTMVAAGITNAGLWQSAVLMTDLKTAYLAQASPKVMFQAQLIGSVIGCFVGTGLYRLFTVIYRIPSTNFPVPIAYMFVNTARLANGGDLPEGVSYFLVAAFFVSAILRTITIQFPKSRWKKWIPSAVAISMGMYVPPSVTLAKFIGAALRLYFMTRWSVSEVALMAIAAGCILGEGTLGFIPSVFGSIGLPRLMRGVV
ncbi:OPT oligopeptide transporter protein-domain-containing protein [Biscogniauxia marginata]|nr:OPT oligopeptide transporter protein-domain-containing protein [Biscogniauxia marginata]